MPNDGIKITDLPAASEVLDSDVLAGVGGGVTRKFTFATIASYISTKLTALFAAKQDKITANGVLQGDGDGGVTAKTLDTSSLTNDNNHIPTSGVVKSALDAKLPMSVLLSRGQRAVIDLSTYQCAVMAFCVTAADNSAFVLFSDGYIRSELTGTPTSIYSVALSSDYKKITIQHNGTAGSLPSYLGVVFFPSADGQTCTITVESIP